MTFCAPLSCTTGTAGFARLRDYESPEMLALVERVQIAAGDRLRPDQIQLRLELESGRTLRSEREGVYRLTWERSAVRSLPQGRRIGCDLEQLVTAVACVEEARRHRSSAPRAAVDAAAPMTRA